MIEKIENEIKNNYYLSNYSNGGQRFVAWYLRNIYNLDEIVCSVSSYVCNISYL